MKLIKNLFPLLKYFDECSATKLLEIIIQNSDLVTIIPFINLH